MSIKFPPPIEFPPKKRDIVGVYDFYDEPLLYTFIAGKHGDLYLALFASEDDTHKVWLVTQVTATRVTDMVCGRMDLRDMFLRSEFCEVWQFHLPRLLDVDPFCTRQRTERGELTDDILPPVGDRLVRRSETVEKVYRVFSEAYLHRK